MLISEVRALSRARPLQGLVHYAVMPEGLSFGPDLLARFGKRLPHDGFHGFRKGLLGFMFPFQVPRIVGDGLLVMIAAYGAVSGKRQVRISRYQGFAPLLLRVGRGMAHRPDFIFKDQVKYFTGNKIIDIGPGHLQESLVFGFELKEFFPCLCLAVPQGGQQVAGGSCGIIPGLGMQGIKGEACLAAEGVFRAQVAFKF